MYSYHDTPLNLDRIEKDICRCKSTEEGRVHNLIDLLNDGEIKIPDQNHDGSDLESKLIFAVCKEYTVHVALDGDRPTPNSIKHETLFHNSDVRAAGELFVQRGVINSLNDHSASYSTYGLLESDPDFAAAILQVVEISQIPISEALRIQLHEYAGTIDEKN